MKYKKHIIILKKRYLTFVALDLKISLHFSKNYDIDYNEIEYYAWEVNRKYERLYKKKELDKSDDFEIEM